MITNWSLYIILSLVSLAGKGVDCSSDYFHAIHLSKCEIQYNADANTLEVATQIYLDDLQTVLAKEGASDLHLCTDKEVSTAEAVLSKYLDKKLQIQIDNKATAGKFIGKEASEDQLAVWSYMEYPMPSNFNQIKVKYNVLMELYDDQKNIINIKVKGKTGYMLFNSKHFEESVNY
ncbi:MAG: hypothetical protein KA109_05790 [Saprospiraceae bacterium]|nr:hypothetical protein [Saprospiraceae bacterium]MBK7370079.1 hypothetical protein [Saprospiraceae bacterium]MBK8280991.1 hypothetical protein [Saprospiraceae bacterium]MBK8512169.1 hypothetical protein [Saprospiraceae bacterium]MBP7801109.1 hypothetical protein [Saprospiraceae bacterium]